jgi:hypothetical protein
LRRPTRAAALPQPSCRCSPGAELPPFLILPQISPPTWRPPLPRRSPLAGMTAASTRRCRPCEWGPQGRLPAAARLRSLCMEPFEAHGGTGRDRAPRPRAAVSCALAACRTTRTSSTPTGRRRSTRSTRWVCTRTCCAAFTPTVSARPPTQQPCGTRGARRRHASGVVGGGRGTGAEPCHLARRTGFEKPSAIQQKGIVPFIKGHDVIQQAQSGTGKTATFCAGILNNLDYGLQECQALVLAPTRELAQQIEKVMRALGDYLQVGLPGGLMPRGLRGISGMCCGTSWWPQGRGAFGGGGVCVWGGGARCGRASKPAESPRRICRAA